MCCDTLTWAVNWILFLQNCSNCPDRPWGPPSLLYNGYRVFPGVKRPGHGVDHTTPYSNEVKERVELYIYSPSGSSCHVLGWTLPLPLPSVLFYCIWRTQKYTGKIIQIITRNHSFFNPCIISNCPPAEQIFPEVGRTTQKVEQTLLRTRLSSHSVKLLGLNRSRNFPV